MRIIFNVFVLATLLCGVKVFNLCAADRDMIVEGAKKEGALVVYTSMTVDQMQKILDAFKARILSFERTCSAQSERDC